MCRVQADLLRLRKAEGRSARRQYVHIKAVAIYADLESLKTEQLHILLTVNSLDPKDYRFRDKVLEAVGDRGDQMNEGVFIRLLSEHEILIEDIRAGETSRPSTWSRGSMDRKKATCGCWGGD